MSLRHALLGLLTDHPQTGYDLSKRFEESLSRYAWHAGHGHIYPELRKLTADGLIEIVGEGTRGSKTYGITERGSAELREWMFTPKDTPVRSESALRLFLLSALDPEDTRTLIDQVIERAEADAAELRMVIQGIEATAQPGEKPPFARFAAEFGLRFQEFQRDWAQWALHELESAAAPTAR